MSIRRSQGFTLTELLVVMGIIAVLAGILTPSLMVARKSAMKKHTKSRIIAFSGALSSFQLEWGDYPPTDMGVGGNGINSGIESLVAHLASQRKGGPYLAEIKEDEISNTDGDSLVDPEVLEELNWIFGDGQLREIVDAWGNPLVYFHNAEYGRPFMVHESVDSEKKKVMVNAAHSEVTATYQSPTGYQIWSLGPDGKNQDGNKDDIGSW